MSPANSPTNIQVIISFCLLSLTISSVENDKNNWGVIDQESTPSFTDWARSYTWACCTEVWFLARLENLIFSRNHCCGLDLASPHQNSCWKLISSVIGAGRWGLCVIGTKRWLGHGGTTGLMPFLRDGVVLCRQD